MKFKILKGTALYNDLLALQGRINDANKAAKALSVKYGAYGYAGGRGVGGGIRALCYREKPEGFKLVQHPDYYYPKVSLKVNRGLVDEIAALPVVHNSDLNALLGFASGMTIDEATGGFRHTMSPGIRWDEMALDFALVDTGAGTCKPHQDLIEILESEYLALQGK